MGTSYNTVIKEWRHDSTLLRSRVINYRAINLLLCFSRVEVGITSRVYIQDSWIKNKFTEHPLTLFPSLKDVSLENPKIFAIDSESFFIISILFFSSFHDEDQERKDNYFFLFESFREYLCRPI